MRSGLKKERCSSKMKPRLQAEWVVLNKEFFYFGELLYESDEEEFSLRAIKG